MYAGQLIGVKAVRTAPVDRGEIEVGYSTGIITKNIDNSFTDEPILILAATESHIVYKIPPEFSIFEDSGEMKVLNYEYCDDKWTSWDDLLSLADTNHIDMMKKLQDS